MSLPPHWFSGHVEGLCVTALGGEVCNERQHHNSHFNSHPSSQFFEDAQAEVYHDPVLPPDFFGRRSTDGMLALRQEFDQVVDESGVKDERIRSLRRQLAGALESVEKQAIALAKIDELVGQRDMVRGSELRTLLEQIR